MDRPVITVWQCSGDIEQRWALALCEAQQAEAELDEDLTIALARDPYEETDVRLEDAFYCELYYQDPVI